MDELNGGKFILGILTSTIMHIARMNFTLTVNSSLTTFFSVPKWQVSSFEVVCDTVFQRKESQHVNE